MRIRCLGFVLLVLFGCGRAPVPVPVQGTVTLDGKPLAEGKIFFIFAGKVPESLDVKDGRYAGKVLPGARRVEIAAYRLKEIPADIPKSMHALIEPGRENYLPDRYHRDSDLTANVTAAGENDFTFTLVSRAE